MILSNIFTRLDHDQRILCKVIIQKDLERSSKLRQSFSYPALLMDILDRAEWLQVAAAAAVVIIVLLAGNGDAQRTSPDRE